MAAIVFGAVHMLIQAQMFAFELIKSSSETIPPPPPTHLHQMLMGRLRADTPPLLNTGHG